MVRVRVSCFLASVAIGQTSAAPPASTLVSAPPRHALTNCTGSSAQLPAAQCAAWQAFYDGAGGEGWALTIPGSGNPPICPGTRNDPCACHGWVGNNPICNSAGTSVVKMCVSGPRHRYSPLLGIPSAHPHTPLAAAACACLLIPPRPPPSPPVLQLAHQLEPDRHHRGGGRCVGRPHGLSRQRQHAERLCSGIGRALDGARGLPSGGQRTLRWRAAGARLRADDLWQLWYEALANRLACCSPHRQGTPTNPAPPPRPVLTDHPNGGTNAFTCPWPKGATTVCMKGAVPDYVPLTDADCTPAL